jgi:hypothetical protein
MQYDTKSTVLFLRKESKTLMNRTVKSCFAAGAAFAALALASAAQAQFAMSTTSASGATGRTINVVVSASSQGGAVNTAQGVIIYDSTFLSLAGVSNTSAAVEMHPDALANPNGWSRQPQSTSQSEPTDALWPAPQKSIKILAGAASAGTFDGNLFIYHFRWTGGVGATQIAFTNSRFPDVTTTTPVAGSKRTRFTNAGVVVGTNTFNPGSLNLTAAVPAPSAALAFAAGLPLLGVALRRRK